LPEVFFFLGRAPKPRPVSPRRERYQGYARRHSSRFSGDSGTPSHCTEKTRRQRCGHGQGREEMSTSAAGGDQKPGHGPFPTRQACKQARLLCELPWPAPDVFAPPRPACTAGALAFVLRSSRGCRGPSLAPPPPPWKPASTAATPRLPLRLLQEGPGLDPTSWWAVMTPCASGFPLPRCKVSPGRRSGMAAARFRSKVQWQPQRRALPLTGWKPNNSWSLARGADRLNGAGSDHVKPVCCAGGSV